MKRRLARSLRRAAHRLDPDPIDSIEVEWPQLGPPHVDIKFKWGARVAGAVVDEERWQALVDSGEFASKGAARRASGEPAPLPLITEQLTRLLRGLAGERPRLPNKARITPNRGDSPCVCGAIHPCCRFLVDGGCAHRTPGDHHHAPNKIAEFLEGADG